jgi:hypothetical protein
LSFRWRGGTGGWLAEGESAPSDAATIDSVTATPHCAAARLGLSRKVRNGAREDIEAAVLRELQQCVAAVLEAGFLVGSGSDDQPLGLINTPGIGTETFAGAVPTLAELVAFHRYTPVSTEGERLNEVEIGVSDECPQDPEEGFFVLVVALSGDVEILQVSLAVESDLAGLNLAVLLVDLVADQHDGDVVADPGQVLVPLGDVLVGDACGDIEHENGGLCPDVVALSESSEFFLAGCVPE